MCVCEWVWLCISCVRMCVLIEGKREKHTKQDKKDSLKSNDTKSDVFSETQQVKLNYTGSKAKSLQMFWT